MRLSKTDVEEIRKCMFGLNNGSAKIMAEQLAQKLKVDVSRIYHYSKDIRPKRKAREDKGDIRCVNDDELSKLMIFTIQHDYSAKHLSMVAEENGISIHPATYNRILRDQRLSRKELKKNLKPWQPWEAKYPNLLHQIDSTVAQQFYLDDDGSIGYEAPWQRYKNKPGNRKPRLHLIASIDDNSRVLFARFTLGNHTSAWMDTLYRFWEFKNNPAFPTYGICKLLYSDNDSVIKSRRFKRAMDRLGVTIVSHEVGNSRAKGKVERSFRMLQEFEKVTKIKKFKSLEEANEALFDFLIGLNNRVHSTTKEVPFARWLRIDTEKLRNTPSEEIFDLLHQESTMRLVHGDLTVKMFGKDFYLPRRLPFINFVAKKIEVCWYPRQEERIFVIIEDKEYEIIWQETPMLGVGQAAIAKDAELPQHLVKRQKLEEAATPDWKLTGFYEEKYGQQWLNKEGKEFDESRITNDKPALKREQTKLWLINRLQSLFLMETPPTSEERAFVDEIFAGKDKLEERYLDDIVNRLRTGDMEITRRQAI